MNTDELFKAWCVRELVASGRQDLVKACALGRMSLQTAREMATGAPRSWDLATDEEKNQFLGRAFPHFFHLAKGR